MFNDHQTEQIDRVLNDVADELLDAADIDAPPVDVLRLAGALGMLVAWDQGQSGRARLVRMSGGSSRAARSTIFLRPEPRAERQHWAVAHEIGEHAAHHVFDRLAIDPRDDRPTNRERVADALASRLLLPKRWYLEDARHGGWDLFALKSRYATASHELIAADARFRRTGDHYDFRPRAGTSSPRQFRFGPATHAGRVAVPDHDAPIGHTWSAGRPASSGSWLADSPRRLAA